MVLRGREGLDFLLALWGGLVGGIFVAGGRAGQELFALADEYLIAKLARTFEFSMINLLLWNTAAGRRFVANCQSCRVHRRSSTCVMGGRGYCRTSDSFAYDGLRGSLCGWKR